MKLLADIFASCTLTPDQKGLLAALQSFLDGGDRCFLLKGYAGTGKTFMMDGLTRYLVAMEIPFRLMAPTGRAAKVISQKTSRPASTIHKAIYVMDRLKEYKTQDVDGTETYKYYFDLAVNDDDARTIYIVDESSMISDAYSEAEFFRFGSGHLLRDLLQYVNLDENDHRKKVIFIGDAAQLPPVNSRMSPALDEKYLTTMCNLRPRSYELTQVVRQRETSAILANASAVRDAIRNQRYNVLDIKTACADVTAVDASGVLSTYLSACAQSSDEQTIIVAHSNRQVKNYNDVVRQHRYPDQPTISPGDRVLIVHNNYRHEIPLMNGEFGVVVDVGDSIESRTVYLNKPVKGKRVNVPVDLGFRDVVVRFNDIQNRPHNIRCKVNENLLNSNEGGLSSDESKALYVDFKNRHRSLSPGSPAFLEAIQGDPFFNCLHVKYGYAVTCHKAQGGEWQHVLVDFGTTMGYFNEHYFRWAYTAMTRAQSHLYALDAPHFGVLSPTRSHDVETTQPNANVMCVGADALTSAIAFDMPEGEPFPAMLFYAVFDRIKDSGVGIVDVTHKQFCEHYTFARGSHTAVALVDYTARRAVSHVRWKPGCDPVLSAELAPLLSALEGKTIVCETRDAPKCAPQISIPPDIDYLHAFYAAMREKISGQGIEIAKVEHPTAFHGKYVFMQSGHTAEMNYYFNGKGCLTTRTPDLARTTSDDLLHRVLELTS
jgi:hypothetical protein